jgi:NAD(P)-dependent dehydrogenase (short-subunit alcohol dehydrogenase family)
MVSTSDSARFYANYLGDNYEDFQRRCAERSALKRLPTLDEIAAVACLICLPAASYLTAQTIMVDGGFTISFPGAK